MRALIACEYSGRVRDAFIRRGHDAMADQWGGAGKIMALPVPGKRPKQKELFTAEQGV